jgi:hypothetical protein
MGRFFDVAKALKGCGLRAEVVEKIERDVRAEFPHDDLMYELHLLRALKATFEKTKPNNPTS